MYLAAWDVVSHASTSWFIFVLVHYTYYVSPVLRPITFADSVKTTVLHVTISWARNMNSKRIRASTAVRETYGVSPQLPSRQNRCASVLVCSGIVYVGSIVKIVLLEFASVKTVTMNVHIEHTLKNECASVPSVLKLVLASQARLFILKYSSHTHTTTTASAGTRTRSWWLPGGSVCGEYNQSRLTRQNEF